MREFIEPSLDDSNNDLPDVLDVSEKDVEFYRDVWVDWVAGDKKFLPNSGGFLDQPARMMRTFYLLDSVSGKITRQLLEQRREKPAAEN